ncbi:MAG TPA: sugar ABC transporter substrate-binding protein, partial [Clostridiales bacterium]|nr:sugar ABC transporter substrate-binding protein [Clostridiales bacterium]
QEAAPAPEEPSAAPAETPSEEAAPASEAPANDIVVSSGSDLSLDDYTPAKDTYNFFFTYKLVHPWWDAVGLGLAEAQAQYAAQGITINYEYTAPVTPDAIDQVNRLEEAAGRNFDVLGVDVADIEVVTPTINNLVEQGVKVMTFSSSDATKEDGCERIAYVGNTHNYEDGCALAEELAEQIGYEGQVAGLGGTIGAPVHEQRIEGFKDTMAKYPDIEVVEIQYDNDQVEQALTYAEGFLQKYPDLKGIFCNNMGNPIGAAQAVSDANKAGQIVLVGMDHDLRALEYLRDGVITVLGVQDCFKMGFDTIQVAVKIADGVMPGPETYPEQTEEQTTFIYQDGAQEMIDLLYPDA